MFKFFVCCSDDVWAQAVRGLKVGREKVLGGQVLVYLVLFTAGEFPRRRCFTRTSAFAVQIWWVQVLGGEMVSMFIRSKEIILYFRGGKILLGKNFVS